LPRSQPVAAAIDDRRVRGLVPPPAAMCLAVEALWLVSYVHANDIRGRRATERAGPGTAHGGPARGRVSSSSTTAGGALPSSRLFASTDD
jgi:hypothetical protein